MHKDKDLALGQKKRINKDREYVIRQMQLFSGAETLEDITNICIKKIQIVTNYCSQKTDRTDLACSTLIGIENTPPHTKNYITGPVCDKASDDDAELADDYADDNDVDEDNDAAEALGVRSDDYDDLDEAEYDYAESQYADYVKKIKAYEERYEATEGKKAEPNKSRTEGDMSKFTREMCIAYVLVRDTALKEDTALANAMKYCVICCERMRLSWFHEEWRGVIRPDDQWSDKSTFIDELCINRTRYKATDDGEESNILCEDLFDMLQDYDPIKANIDTFIMRCCRRRIRESILKTYKYHIPFTMAEWEARGHVLRALHELKNLTGKAPTSAELSNYIAENLHRTISVRMIDKVRRPVEPISRSFGWFKGGCALDEITVIDRLSFCNNVTRGAYDLASLLIQRNDEMIIAKILEDLPPISRVCIDFSASADAQAKNTAMARLRYVRQRIPGCKMSAHELAFLARTAERTVQQELLLQKDNMRLLEKYLGKK